VSYMSVILPGRIPDMGWPEKSPEHKKRIAAGVRRYHQKQRRLKEVIDRLQFVLMLADAKNFPPTYIIGEIVEALFDTVRLLADEQKSRQEQVKRWQQTYALRDRLEEAVDQTDDGKMKRPVKGVMFAQALPSPMGSDIGGVAIGGFLACVEQGCSTMVDVRDGPYCKQHQKPAPRTFVTMGHQARNLDSELTSAEQHFARAKRDCDRAEAKVEDLKKQIESYDRAHRSD